MLLTDYPSIRGEDLPDYDKKATWNLLNSYIDAQNKIIIYEYPKYGEQAISILQCKCANMTFADQIRHNRLFQQVTHKGGDSVINYIKIFHNAKALAISVGNSSSEDQLINTILDNF